MTSKVGYTASEILLMIMLPVVFCIWLISMWLTGSLMTSAIKISEKKCGHTYPVEVVLNGDWFCSEEIG